MSTITTKIDVIMQKTSTTGATIATNTKKDNYDNVKVPLVTNVPNVTMAAEESTVEKESTDVNTQPTETPDVITDDTKEPTSLESSSSSDEQSSTSPTSSSSSSSDEQSSTSPTSPSPSSDEQSSTSPTSPSPSSDEQSSTSPTSPSPSPSQQQNANAKDNPMKKIRLEKVVLNMGMGKSGESINIAKKALEQITNGLKPCPRSARDSQRDWGVRKGEPIGVSITIRGQNAKDLLKRLLDAKGNIVNGKSFDEFGNYSFGIREHIDIPGVKYEPQIGILGLGVSVALARPGYSIRKRSKHRTSIGRTHVISSKAAQSFIMSEFGVQVE